MEEERRKFLRLCGLSGILAGLLFIPGNLLYPLIPPGPPPTDADLLGQFERYRPLAVTHFSLVFVHGILSIFLFVGLYRSLQASKGAFALLGTVLGVLAFAMILPGITIEYGANSILSELYTQSAAADRNAVLAVYRGVFSLGGVFLFVTISLLGVAFLAIGQAMKESDAFEPWVRWMTTIFGIVIVLAMVVTAMAIAGLVGGFAFLGFISASILGQLVWPILVGWKIYRLSKVAT